MTLTMESVCASVARGLGAALMFRAGAHFFRMTALAEERHRETKDDVLMFFRAEYLALSAVTTAAGLVTLFGK